MAPLRQISRRTLIPQAGVEPLAIVEYLNIPEQVELRLGARGVPLMLSQFALERGPETLLGALSWQHPGRLMLMVTPALATTAW